MKKNDIVSAIAEAAELSKADAGRALDAFVDCVTNSLKAGESVTLVGFGTFIQRHRGARTGQNPQTGEPVKIKASNTVAFKPGKFLKDSVNP
ncbi:MAG: HU family DNA-binding protein [Xanthomonadales bacterium]|nr:HU family DNA-binding protein [Xanthomonadales bacterium]